MSRLDWAIIAVSAIIALPVMWMAYGALLESFTQKQRCVFDRNDIGPKDADGGQWWYDVYQCPDGTERRVLVAGPRG